MSDLHEVGKRDEAPEPDPDDPRGVDLWIMPYLTDQSLLPVLIVLIAAAAAFAAPAILYAVRDLRPVSIFTMALMAYFSFRGIRWEGRNRSRFGAISRLIVIVWIVSFAFAYFGDRWGIL